MQKTCLLALLLAAPEIVSGADVAQAQCFATQTATAQATAGEKTVTFDKRLHLCDADGNTSGDIDNATVLFVKEKREYLVGNTQQLKDVYYFEFTYDYYNGTGTSGGWQPVSISVQDVNHRELRVDPLYSDNTPRQSCLYGHPIPVRYEGLLSVFDLIHYVTITAPRVAGVQHSC